jgi:hypothetical protein
MLSALAKTSRISDRLVHRMRRVLLLLVAAAALLAGWFLFRKSAAQPAANAAPSATTEHAASDARTIVPVNLSATDPAPAGQVAPQSNSAQKPANPAGNGTPATKGADLAAVGSSTAPTGTTFQEQHKNLTREEAQTLLNTLSQRLAEDRRALFDERFARGDFVVIRPGAAPPLIPMNAAGISAETEGSTSTNPTGTTEARLSWLPFDEYPDYYQSKANVDWLKQRLK